MYTKKNIEFPSRNSNSRIINYADFVEDSTWKGQLVIL